MLKAYGKMFCEPSRAAFAAWLTVALSMMLTGCASRSTPPAGPASASAYRSDPWDARYPHTRSVSSGHYRIFTDLQDRQALDQLVQVMEGAYQQYRLICPAVPPTSDPLRCYVFTRREEWAAFTARNTGKDAAVYLRINRGAYAVDDWFVAFWLGDHATFGVVAHEGWHQFVGRHFAARMPPALEEGIGCMFENIHWTTTGLPRWNLQDNAARQLTLGDTLAAGRFMTLSDLLRLHAGDVINTPREQIAAFYAQSWAMALFLLDDQSRYRPAMDRYFADLATGQVYRPANLAHLKTADWHPGLGQPQLEHYLGKPLSMIEDEYRQFAVRLSRKVEQ